REIHPVEHVEGAEADFDRWPFVRLLPDLRLLQKEFLRPAQIDGRYARPLQAVTAHPSGPVIGNRVVIVIAPGCHAVGAAGRKRNRHPQVEQVSCFERPQQVEAVAPTSGRLNPPTPALPLESSVISSRSESVALLPIW